jgi:hypothetical protein
MFQVLILLVPSHALSGCMASKPSRVQGSQVPGAGQHDPIEVPGSSTIDHQATAPRSTGPSSRDTVRMSLRQVNNSIITIFGAPWSVNDGGGNRYKFADFAYSLGAPDYYSRLSEDLAPQMMFAQGLEEGALAICGDAIAADPMKPAAQRAVLRRIDDVTNATGDQINANLADMKLRFHGIDVGGDMSRLSPYLDLYNRVAQMDPMNGPSNGWYAVCVAMVTDDAFAIF